MDKFHSTLRKVTIPCSEVPPEGRVAIVRYLKHKGHTLISEPTSFGSEWSWDWCVTGKGEFVGTLPKRISKFFHRYHKVYPNRFKKLSKEEITELGNIGSNYCVKSSTYWIRFTDTIDWSPGDFGDGGSCFWGGRSIAKDMILDAGGHAVQLYTSKSMSDRLARAWIVPYGGTQVIFNTYSIGCSITSLRMARIVAQHWGESYKRCGLENRGSSDDLLYINGGSGWVVGIPEVLDTFCDNPEIDLDIDAGSTYYCDCCDADYAGDAPYTSPGGTPICESCYEENCCVCDHCGSTEWESEAQYVTVSSGATDTVCRSCVDTQTTECSNCTEWSYTFEVVDGRCEQCHQEHIEEEQEALEEEREEASVE